MNCIFLRRGYGTSGDGVNYVEYLECDGSQYFKTGIIPNQDTRVVIDVQLTDTSSTSAIFGARQAYQNKAFSLNWVKTGYFRSDYGSAATQTWYVDGTSMRTIDKNKQTTTIDGIAKSDAYTSFTAPCELTIFAENTAGTPNYRAKGKTSKAQIYQGDVLIAYYRAAIDPDGVACYFDEVTKKYCYWEGTPVAGPAISGGSSKAALTITINDNGFEGAGYRYVTVNGVKYESADLSQTIDVTKGDVIAVYCYSEETASKAQITLDGTAVATGTASGANYTFAIASDTTITFTGALESGQYLFYTAAITTS